MPIRTISLPTTSPLPPIISVLVSVSVPVFLPLLVPVTAIAPTDNQASLAIVGPGPVVRATGGGVVGESEARGFLSGVAVVVVGVGEGVGAERRVAGRRLGGVSDVGAVGVGEGGGALDVISTWI